MVGDRRAKKAAKAYSKALAGWGAERDAYAELVEIARTFSGRPPDGLLLEPGEVVFYSAGGVDLVDEHGDPPPDAGRSRGALVSIRSKSGRSIQYRAGANRGELVAAPFPTEPVDTGTFYVTNQRVLFRGDKQTREGPFRRLVGYQHWLDGSTTIALSNRQKPITIRYGPDLAAPLKFRLDLAIAHFRGETNDFIRHLEDGLAEIDARKPCDPELTGPSASEAALLDTDSA